MSLKKKDSVYLYTLLWKRKYKLCSILIYSPRLSCLYNTEIHTNNVLKNYKPWNFQNRHYLYHITEILSLIISQKDSVTVVTLNYSTSLKKINNFWNLGQKYKKDTTDNNTFECIKFVGYVCLPISYSTWQMF